MSTFHAAFTTGPIENESEIVAAGAVDAVAIDRRWWLRTECRVDRTIYEINGLGLRPLVTEFLARERNGWRLSIIPAAQHEPASAGRAGDGAGGAATERGS